MPFSTKQHSIVWVYHIVFFCSAGEESVCYFKVWKIWTKPVLASPCYFSCRCRFSDPLSKQGSWIREYFSKKLSHRLPVYHRPPAINENFCGSTSSQAFVYHDVLDLGHFNMEWCLFLIYIFLIKWSTMLSTCLLHIFLSPLVMLSTKVNFSSGYVFA